MQDEEQLCRYRIVQDGLPLLLPHVTRQLLQPTVTELLHLIEDRSLYVPEEARSAPAKPAQASISPGVADNFMKQEAQLDTSTDQPENAEPNAPSRALCYMFCLLPCALVSCFTHSNTATLRNRVLLTLLTQAA